MTQFLPTTLIAHTLCAAAILAHFGTATKALTPACALVVPGTVIPRPPGWTPHRRSATTPQEMPVRHPLISGIAADAQAATAPPGNASCVHWRKLEYLAQQRISPPMATTVHPLGCLIREQLVSSEVVRRSDAARAIPFYVLTDKGAAVAPV